MTSCSWCNTDNLSLLQCAQCHQVKYCNKECQKRHWVIHKIHCAQDPLSTNETYERMEQVNSRVSLLPGLGILRDAMIQHYGQMEPLPFFWSQYLEVRPSDIHGNGVFALRHLPPNAVLTGYPCHLSGINGEVLQICDGTVDATPNNIQHLADCYSYPLGDHLLMGLPDRYNEKRLLGHILNEACLVNVFRNTPLESLRHLATLGPLLKLYYRNVLRYANCEFRQSAQNITVCIVSRREIAPGEELLLSYGLPYWIDLTYGANTVKNNPFIQKNMLLLRKNDPEYRTLSDEGMIRDFTILQSK